MTQRVDREIADAQAAVGLTVVGVYRDGFGSVPTIVLEGKDRKMYLRVLSDPEGNGPGSLWVDVVEGGER